MYSISGWFSNTVDGNDVKNYSAWRITLPGEFWSTCSATKTNWTLLMSHKSLPPHTHLPLYTNFIGSTANAVATMSSALCLRPLTMMSPSILPVMKMRPPGPMKPSRPVRTKAYSLISPPLALTG